MRYLSVLVFLFLAVDAQARECKLGNPNIIATRGLHQSSDRTMMEIVNITGSIIRIAHINVHIDDLHGVTVGDFDTTIQANMIPFVPLTHFMDRQPIAPITDISPDRYRIKVCVKSILLQGGKRKHFR